MRIETSSSEVQGRDIFNGRRVDGFVLYLETKAEAQDSRCREENASRSAEQEEGARRSDGIASAGASASDASVEVHLPEAVMLRIGSGCEESSGAYFPRVPSRGPLRMHATNGRRCGVTPRMAG